jgi:hypothetical protein
MDGGPFTNTMVLIAKSTINAFIEKYPASAKVLTTFIEHKIKDELENKSQMLATKEDISILNTKIEQSKAETIKWMFIFWIGQVVATFGFILLFLKK